MIFGTYTILRLKLFLLIIGINFPKKSMSIGELELINFNVKYFIVYYQTSS